VPLSWLKFEVSHKFYESRRAGIGGDVGSFVGGGEGRGWEGGGSDVGDGVRDSISSGGVHRYEEEGQLNKMGRHDTTSGLPRLPRGEC
jgi:hypothetical protein